MRHFIAYHNTEKMGYPLRFDGDFRFHTNKSGTFLEKSIGGRLWVITGKFNGKSGSRVYRLLACFTPRQVRVSDRGSFKFQVVGRKGYEFRDPPVLDDWKWFPRLKKSSGNFAFGCHAIRSQKAISGLIKIRSKSKLYSATV